MAHQNKAVVIDGQIATINWDVDEDAISASVPWAKGRTGREMLSNELEDVCDPSHFPYFIATLAQEDRLKRCRNCHDILVWRNGLEYLSCGKIYNTPSRAQLAYWGQIPIPMGKVDEYNRPILKESYPILEKIINDLERGCEVNNDIYRLYIGEPINGTYYFMPPITCIFPDNWNRSEPKITLQSEYFQILGLERAHIYPVDGRLCIFSHWPRINLRSTLQQRIVPRIIIDLMLASLKHVNGLSRVLSDLGISLNEVYNWIGKPRRSRRFQEKYSRYINF